MSTSSTITSAIPATSSSQRTKDWLRKSGDQINDFVNLFENMTSGTKTFQAAALTRYIKKHHMRDSVAKKISLFLYFHELVCRDNSVFIFYQALTREGYRPKRGEKNNYINHKSALDAIIGKGYLHGRYKKGNIRQADLDQIKGYINEIDVFRKDCIKDPFVWPVEPPPSQSSTEISHSNVASSSGASQRYPDAFLLSQWPPISSLPSFSLPPSLPQDPSLLIAMRNDAIMRALYQQAAQATQAMMRHITMWQGQQLNPYVGQTAALTTSPRSSISGTSEEIDEKEEEEETVEQVSSGPAVQNPNPSSSSTEISGVSPWYTDGRISIELAHTLYYMKKAATQRGRTEFKAQKLDAYFHAIPRHTLEEKLSLILHYYIMAHPDQRNEIWDHVKNRKKTEFKLQTLQRQIIIAIGDNNYFKQSPLTNENLAQIELLMNQLISIEAQVPVQYPRDASLSETPESMRRQRSSSRSVVSQSHDPQMPLSHGSHLSFEQQRAIMSQIASQGGRGRAHSLSSSHISQIPSHPISAAPASVAALSNVPITNPALTSISHTAQKRRRHSLSDANNPDALSSLTSSLHSASLSREEEPDTGMDLDEFTQGGTGSPPAWEDSFDATEEALKNPPPPPQQE
ncbi:MAG TPA: hypothetical protein VLF61_04480 [Rhabdochlamydiaceae bacterium]|nr:hypothetical protein [Rhabdochlamydiaceae bacterium]